jgi:K+-transporting ATPase KdpF subunit
MGAADVILLVIAIALLGYLGMAMFNPERF